MTRHPLQGLAGSLVARPCVWLGLVLALTCAASVFASRLPFDGSYFALMPSDAEEVITANEVRNATGGNRLLVLVLRGGARESRLAFGREIARHLEDLEEIRWATAELPSEFFQDRALWMMESESLARLEQAVDQFLREARRAANPLLVDLDSTRTQARLDAAWQEVEAIAFVQEDRLSTGPFESRDQSAAFVVAAPTIRIMDIAGGERLFAQIDAMVSEIGGRYTGVGVAQAGKFAMVLDQQTILQRDLRISTAVALLVSILVIALFLRRLAAPFIIAAGLIPGVVWTLACAEIAVGQLNLLTGFLIAPLIGLGVDFGIHIVTRFEQSRRLDAAPPSQAAVEAVLHVTPPAAFCALTTSCAFLACATSDFRGLSEFGVLAAAGVPAMLLSSVLTIPPLLVLRGRSKVAQRRKHRSSFAFVRLQRYRTYLAAAVVFAASIWALAGALLLGELPFHNDFRWLSGGLHDEDLYRFVEENLTLGFDPVVVICPDLSSADAVRVEAERVQAAREARGATSNLDRVLTAASLVPGDTLARASRMSALADTLHDRRLTRATADDPVLSDGLTKLRRMTAFEPWELEEVPKEYRNLFTTAEGEQPLALIWPTVPVDSDIVALAWEGEVDAITGGLSNLDVEYTVSREALMPAWVHRMMSDDLPMILLTACIAVLLVVSAQFRRIEHIVVVALTLATGVLSFLGLMSAFGQELNMLNIVAIPCIVGIGIDDVIHLYHRYLRLGPGSIGAVVRRTGAAVLLTSLTTGAGFGALLLAHHRGLQSLGVAALLGVAVTFLAAVVFLPCVVIVLEAWKRRVTTTVLAQLPRRL